MKDEPVVIERTIDAEIETVWNSITDKDLMKQWYFDIPGFIPEKGLEFQFEAGDEKKKYVHLCKITEVIPTKKLSHSWRYEGYEGDSFVTWDLSPQGNKTLVKLTHKDLESFPSSNPDLAKENFIAGWTEIIGTNLPDFLKKKQMT
ncbi:SRPBCC domain-containing protein [Pedobacter sp. P351]|uniref:SRPBCC family protein n=1 Tax=Pedobacter superstes TaxID=3133441 RepID=UPI0030B03796